MMKSSILLLSMLFLFILPAFSQVIDFDDERWKINSRAHLIENKMGNKSLYLQGGLAFLPDADFKNGIIEFDMFMTERVSFSGMIFRIRDNQNYEEFYTRAHHSGDPDSYQYTPVINGMAGWQIYHDLFTGNNNGLMAWKPVGEVNGYNDIVNYEYNEWMHFKFVIIDSQAELFINNEEKPALFIKDLKGPTESGGIGLKSSAGPTHFANFSYQKNDNIRLQSSGEPKYESHPGQVMKWQISTGFNARLLENRTSLDKEFSGSLKFESLEAEANGLVNISRIHTRTQEVNAAIARLSVNSDRARIVKLEFGFSDAAMIFFENQALYFGNDSFRSRDYRYLGTIGYFDAIYLPLKKGDNIVDFAIAESFGGWGIQARFTDMTGLTIK